MRSALAPMAACVALLAACGRSPPLPPATDSPGSAASAPSAGSQAGAGAAAGLGGAAGSGAGGAVTSGTAGASPPDAAPRAHATSVAVGDRHACAILDDFSVRCWGDGVATPPDQRTVTSAIAIAAGGTETCAILDDGHVTCWSPDDGGSADAPTFVSQLPPGRRARSLAMNSGTWTCAVLDDNSVSCWDNGWSHDQPSKTMSVPVPPASPTIRELILNWPSETMALYEDGTVSTSLQLGILPGTVVDGHTFTAIAGAAESWGWCGVVAGGGVFCDGLLGPSTTDAFTSIAVGVGYGCGLRPDGTVSCWGQIPGCDDTNPALTYWCKTPRNPDGTHDVLLGQRAVSVTVGTYFVDDICAALADGSVRCWGGPDLTSDMCCAPDPILGASVPITRTPTGHAYGAWSAIDLGP